MSKPTSLAQLRRVTQPPEVRLRANAEHWTASLYLRDLSPYVTWVLLRTPVSANGVTALMILTGWATAASLLIPGIWGPVVAVILGQLQMLIDCCDGEVARWRGTKSPSGIFLDKVGHYTTEALIPLALAIRAATLPLTEQGYLWTTLGALLAIVIILNKALNDMVHVSRAHSGQGKLADSRDVKAPTGSVMRRLRGLARFIPFYRLFHSVELTLVALGFGVLGIFIGQQVSSQWLLLIMTPLALLSLIGHFVAIMTSSRVR